ncbi:hypothetical protein [Pedobacter sp. L105]|uniref:hypothetical protein n=1 Tax=Pedobacter sp. L105 TaxID=1641871 RepID=UPI00131B8194|nr:hypothetical protein [Pedobacter sp. L105]
MSFKNSFDRLFINTSFFISLITLSVYSQAQELSVFRSVHTRVGINTLGSSPDNNLSPKQNILKGNYGASTGFVFESGKIFYFQESYRGTEMNYGLDWTFVSLNYNEMNQWNKYGKLAVSQDYAIRGSRITAAISSKVGPVISFNPIEKVVVDVRAQLAPTFRLFDFSYYANTDTPGSDYFSFKNSKQANNDANPESLKNRVGFGLQENFGVTIRRNIIGLSLDYITGKVKANYEARDNNVTTNGKIKIPAHQLQAKISVFF